MEKNWHISVRRAGELLNTADQVAANQAVSQLRVGLAKRAFHGFFDEMEDYEINRLRENKSDPINKLTFRTFDSEGNELTLEFDDVKIDVTRANKIISTQVFNTWGTVKEFLFADDYKVIISGNLKTDNPKKFPVYDLAWMVNFFNYWASYDVANLYLELFDIRKLALEKADFNQSNARFFNVLPFTLTMVSDVDQYFLLEDA